MAVTFDPEKNARNITERGLSFERVAELEWDTAVIAEDARRDYGEPRLLVMARLDARLPATVVTPRGEDLDVISFQGKQTRGKKAWQKRRRMTGPRAPTRTIPNGRRKISPGRGPLRTCCRHLSAKGRPRSGCAAAVAGRRRRTERSTRRCGSTRTCWRHSGRRGAAGRRARNTSCGRTWPGGRKR